MTVTISGTNGITFSDSTLQRGGYVPVNFQRKTWAKRLNPGDFQQKSQPEGWQNFEFPLVFERTHPRSIMWFKCHLAMRTNYSDCVVWEGTWGSGVNGWVQSPQGYDAGFAANSRPCNLSFWMDNLPDGETGGAVFHFRWRTNNSDTANRVAQIMNPNRRGDDVRYTQEYSAIECWEFAQA